MPPIIKINLFLAYIIFEKISQIKKHTPFQTFLGLTPIRIVVEPSTYFNKLKLSSLAADCPIISIFNIHNYYF